MSSLEMPAEAVPSKPCSACRKRKVRCDRLRPCSNCSRSRQTCAYEGIDNHGADSTRISDVSLGDTDVRERLIRLEEMMAVMMKTNQTPTLGTSGVDNANRALNEPATTPSAQNQRSASILDVSSPKVSPIGHIVFQEGEGAYFGNDFWLGLISEIEDLRRIFDAPRDPEAIAKLPSPSLLGIPSIFSTADLTPTYPSVEESNMMLKLFFQSVNPFICVLHQTLFARELDQYRRGTFVWPKEFEALLSSIYLLTISSLRSSVVEQIFTESKEVLLQRYQSSAQASLTKMSFYKTQKIPGIWALLHYVTFLFQQNMYKDAVALLGTTARQAQAMGLHRDPAQFPFSPWVCELRRRIWNHLCSLDGLAISSFGAESCLPATSDSKPPQNANDSDWHASRFANPSSVPSDQRGFKDMSYVLSQRLISDLIRALANLDSNDFQGKLELITESEAKLTSYFQQMGGDESLSAMAKSVVEIRLSSFRLSMKYQQRKFYKLQSSNSHTQGVFTSALEVLEAYQSYAAIFAPLNWEWVFESNIPWLAIAILVTELPAALTTEEYDRARIQIDRILALHDSGPVSQTPMWKMLIQLRQRTQEDHLTGELAEPATIVRVEFEDDFMLGLGDVTFNEDSMVQDAMDMPWLSTSPYI